MYSKVSVTAAEMRTMRENGMSNHDIARSLDVSYQTVLRYIGKQDGRMQSYDAFKDNPAKKEKKEEMVQVATVMPKYNPKPVAESYKIGGVDVTIDNEARMLYVSAGGDCQGEVCIPFDGAVELAKFLEWAARERMAGALDAKQVQEP